MLILKSTYLLVNKTHGVSYIEVLITISIVAIVALFARPASVSMDGYHTMTQVYSIANLFHTGSNIALSSGNQVILCPTEDNAKCVKSWSVNNWMLFINNNNDSSRNNNEQLLLLHVPSSKTFLQFNNSSKPPRFIRWYPGGQINRAFSLAVCPQNQDDTKANVLIVNLQGRVRQGVDSNADEIPELANGSNASCEQQET